MISICLTGLDGVLPPYLTISRPSSGRLFTLTYTIGVMYMVIICLLLIYRFLDLSLSLVVCSIRMCIYTVRLLTVLLINNNYLL